MKETDHHAQGQHDREESRTDDMTDIIISGGSSPSYNPPSDSDDREAYQSGWDNAKK